MHTKIDWQYHIEQQKNSGLNKAEYCRKNNLNKYSFYGHTKNSSIRGNLVELPIFPGFGGLNQIPALEIHFQIPFSFRFRLNLSFGREK